MQGIDLVVEDSSRFTSNGPCLLYCIAMHEVGNPAWHTLRAWLRPGFRITSFRAATAASQLSSKSQIIN
jgi:hypothetical protein